MEAGDQNRRIPQNKRLYQNWDGYFGYYSELRTPIKEHIIISEQTFVYATESGEGNGTMSENELALIMKIRSSDDPEKMMDYIEELLFNPQKFQEASRVLAAQREI